MSVIVKGMEMPENCEMCPIRESTFCDIINKDIDRFYSGSIKRDPDCPLIALPDHHGRLVDADADSLKNKLNFINEAEHQIYGRESWGFTAKCIHAIDETPTIVEAEDSE